jgi:hypothetical protein
MMNLFLHAGTRTTLPDGMTSNSGQSALNSSMDESEREMTPQEADEARTERRLRREIQKLTVEPSPLDDTDTEMADTQETAATQPGPAAAAATATHPLDENAQAAGDAGKEININIEKPVIPIVKKVVVKHFMATDPANPGGAGSGSAKAGLNPSGSSARGCSNLHGEQSLKGQNESTNGAYKAAAALRQSTRVNPNMGREGGSIMEKHCRLFLRY